MTLLFLSRVVGPAFPFEVVVSPYFW